MDKSLPKEAKRISFIFCSSCLHLQCPFSVQYQDCSGMPYEYIYNLQIWGNLNISLHYLMSLWRRTDHNIHKALVLRRYTSSEEVEGSVQNVCWLEALHITGRMIKIPEVFIWQIPELWNHYNLYLAISSKANDVPWKAWISYGRTCSSGRAGWGSVALGGEKLQIANGSLL